MDKKRRILHNETVIEIKRLKNLNTNDNNTINRFKHKVGDVEYNKQQVNKLNTRILERLDKIKELETKLDDIDKGKLDTIINDTYETNLNDIKIKSQQKTIKKQANKEQKQRDKDLYEAKRKSEYNSNKSFYKNEREMQQTYRYYQKTCQYIPQHIKDKLKNRPNNKGFIWRGIYMYGYKGPSGNPDNVSLLEKQGKDLYIHEFFPNRYKVWKKTENNRRKELVFVQDRKRKKGLTNILDYKTSKI